MISLPTETEDVFLKVYIGQNIRQEGILQSEIKEEEQIQTLLSNGLVRENHWFLPQFLTTREGSLVGMKLVKKRIEERTDELRKKLEEIPKKLLGFVIKRYVSKNLAFSTQKPLWSVKWADRILCDDRIWKLTNEIFKSLESVGLCVSTCYYVSTRGGEPRDLRYVISREIQDFLLRTYSTPDFTQNQEETLKLYPFLTFAGRTVSSDDMEYVRQQFYDSLKSYSVTENQVAGIINEMRKRGITSEYRGLLSESKPFDVLDSSRFKIYLDKFLIERAVNLLLERKDEIKQFFVEEKIPALSEVKAELGILDQNQLGEFYILVSGFERQLRQFIKDKLGKSWMKIIEHEFPYILEKWHERERKDKRWGIEPEKELLNYADLEDYAQIVKKHKKMFVDNDEDLGDILANLRMWYNHGRNPLMHSRTVNKQKYFTTKSAIDFLKQWMNRKS